VGACAPGTTPTSAFLATYEREARAEAEASVLEAAGSSASVGFGTARESRGAKVAAVPRVEWAVPSPRARLPPPTAPLPSASAAAAATQRAAGSADAAGCEGALAWASQQVRAAARRCHAAVGDPPLDQLLPVFPYLSADAQRSVMKMLVLKHKLDRAERTYARGSLGSSSGSHGGGSRRAASPNGYGLAHRPPPWGGHGEGGGGLRSGGAGTPLHAAAAAVEPFEPRSSADVAGLFRSSEDLYAMSDAELAKLWAVSPTAAASASNTPGAGSSHGGAGTAGAGSLGRGGGNSSNSSSGGSSSGGSSSSRMMPPPPTASFGALPPSRAAATAAATAAAAFSRAAAAAAALARQQTRAAAGGGRGPGNATASATPWGGGGLSDRDSDSVATFNSDDMLASLGADEDIWGGEFA
jgi:hypothetical protein